MAANRRFGDLLSDAIHLIKMCEGSTVAIVQDELGYALGRKGGSAVERWRQGHLPPTVDDREALARLLVQRSCGRLDRAWLLSFLRSMQHPYPQQVCDDLLPEPATGEGTLPDLTLPAWVRSDIPLVGRAEELRQLTALWQKARTGVNQVAFVTGEAGIGKTRLLHEFITRWHRQGGLWLAARAYKGYQSTPYLMLAEAIQPLLDAGREPAMADAVLAEIGQIIPSAGSSGGDGSSSLSPEPEQAYARKRWALTTFLGTLLAEQPLILWFDDLHWGDRATLESVQHLLLRNPRQPLLVLASLRGTDIEEGSYLTEVWANLYRGGLLTEISLGPLNKKETSRLVETRTGQQDVRALSPALHLHTEGNPFYLLETVQMLLEEGDSRTGAGEAGAEKAGDEPRLPIPDSIEDLIRLRLQTLDETGRRFLELASVVGREFDPELIQRIANLDAPEMARTVDSLQARGMIREAAGRYDFSHSMLRTAIYHGMTAWTRRYRHERVGRRIAERAGNKPSVTDLQQLAHHFYEARAWPETFTYQLRAGLETLALFDSQAAHTYLRTARKVAESELETVATHQQRLLREGLGDVHSNMARFEQALTYYRDALSLLPPDSAGAAALCWKMATVYERQTRYEEALRWLERGMDALQHEQDDVVFSRICIQYGLINVRRGNLEEAFGWASRALVVESAQAHNLLATLYRARGELDEAYTHCTRAIALAEANGQLLDLAKAYTNLGVILFAQNEWERAAEAYRRAIDLHATTDDAYAYVMTLCNLSDVDRHLGNLEEAIHHAQTGVEEARALKAAFSQAHAHFNLGAALLAAGSVEKARSEHLEVARQLLEEQGIKELLAEVECTLAEALLREGALDEAARLAEGALALAREHGTPLDVGRARRVRAETALALGNGEEAARLLEQSAAILRENDFRYELGRTYLSLARLYGQQDELRAEARKRLRAARTIFEELGAQFDLDRADSLAEELER